MPLIGVVDPSHNVRKAQKPGVAPPWLTLEELYEESWNDDPKWSPWSHEMIQAALGTWEERADRISSTLLVAACPRGSVMERKEDFVMPIDNMYAALLGTLMHQLLHRYGRPGSIAEHRFYTTVDEIEFSCSPDLLTPTTVYDYKKTENPPQYSYMRKGHKEQLMVNAYISRNRTHWEDADETPNVDLPFDPMDSPASQVVAVYLAPKWPKQMVATHKEEYITPGGKVIEKDFPYVWSNAESLEFIRPRLHMTQQALEIYPRWPKGAEEVWGGKPGYACPGPPLCYLPNCLAKTDPGMMVWDKGGVNW